MSYSAIPRAARALGLTLGLAALCFSGLSGCDGLTLPPIPVAITIITDAEIIAAEQDDGNVDVALTLFCDLFSEERLDELLTTFGGADIAALVDIPSVELESLEFIATEGDFSAYTIASADLTVIGPSSDPIDLGAVSDANGLGEGFELVAETPLDLLNDLNEDECGVPALHLVGDAAPTEDTRFTVIAHVLVYTQLNFQ